MAVHYGADAIGLVSSMPNGPGVIDEKLITQISQLIPPGANRFLLTSKQSVNEIVDQHKYCKTDTIQICDRLVEGTYYELKEKLPGIYIVQVIHVTDDTSLAEAIEVSPNVHGLLLDSGNQNSQLKSLGGTGRVHDWKISREIVQKVRVPVYLAGGLNPENISDAITNVLPFGIDICSGIRTNQKLDEKKLSALVSQIHRTDKNLLHIKNNLLANNSL